MSPSGRRTNPFFPPALACVFFFAMFLPGRLVLPGLYFSVPLLSSFRIGFRPWADDCAVFLSSLVYVIDFWSIVDNISDSPRPCPLKCHPAFFLSCSLLVIIVSYTLGWRLLPSLVVGNDCVAFCLASFLRFLLSVALAEAVLFYRLWVGAFSSLLLFPSLLPRIRSEVLLPVFSFPYVPGILASCLIVRKFSRDKRISPLFFSNYGYCGWVFY